MLLLDIEKHIKPLSREEKRQLFDFLAKELDIRLPAAPQAVQVDPALFEPLPAYPLWSQYAAYTAANDFEEALKANDLPLL
jgi:hypothetical protein